MRTDGFQTIESSDWLKTIQNFLAVLPGDDVNYISPKIYGSIADCTTYEQAIAALTALYVKPYNEIFARHCLATRLQKPGENLDEFLQALKILSKDCNFKDVTAARHQEETIRDAFISGLQSSIIRQRLLENRTLDLRPSNYV